MEKRLSCSVCHKTLESSKTYIMIGKCAECEFDSLVIRREGDLVQDEGE